MKITTRRGIKIKTRDTTLPIKIYFSLVGKGRGKIRIDFIFFFFFFFLKSRKRRKTKSPIAVRSLTIRSIISIKSLIVWLGIGTEAG